MKVLQTVLAVVLLLESTTPSVQSSFGSIKITVKCNNKRLDTFPSPECTNTSNFNILRLSDNSIRHVRPSMFSSFTNLTDLYLDGNGLNEIDSGSFDNLTSLISLNLENNDLKKMPEFNVQSTVTHLQLSNNPITELSDSLLKNFPDLEYLLLSNTRITYLPSNIFRYNSKLSELSLIDTPLEKIDDKAFAGLPLLHKLYLRGTKIGHLPATGMESVLSLDIRKVKTLWKLPYKSFINLEKAEVEYYFHCCLFREVYKSPDVGTPNFEKGNFTELPICNDTTPVTLLAGTPGTTTSSLPSNTDDEDPFNKFKDAYKKTNKTTAVFPPPLRCVDRNSLPNKVDRKVRSHNEQFQCSPQPDAFNPCEDIMGTIGLRICSWFVIVFALIGNGLQLLVLITSKRNTSMYRLLMSNLAVANFCMGIYLCMTASADLYTYGEYQNHAKEWQFGTGCKVAGFLSILSTELAVYTLTIITMERYYNIVHPLKLEMHLSMKQIGVLVTCGWVFALTLATLPLIGVSSYDKVAICLPFDVEHSISKAYVTFLLITNGLAFLSVLFCYARMYCSLGGARCSNAARIETRVAKRMALLVFSNFACWFPIALLSLVAIYGSPVIDVHTSKFLLVFIFPINAFTNPYLYALGTKHFQLDFLDLVKRFGMCQTSIDKLSNKLRDQLASLPNTSKMYIGSKSSINSCRVSPNHSPSITPTLDSQRRSTRSKSSSTSRDSTASCRFLSLPRIRFSSCRGREDETYSTDIESSCTEDETTSNVPQITSSKPTGLVSMKARRLSAREIIIGGTKLSVACQCQDVKHTAQECRTLIYINKEDSEEGFTEEPMKNNGLYVPSVMVTPC